MNNGHYRIRNCRPLHLLNNNFNFFAQVLATRLQNVLPNLISLDQSGCIKEHSTCANIRSTIDIINYVNVKNIHGLPTFIDYEKAFDTVNLTLIFKCLKRLNIGQYFIQCMKTMSKDVGHEQWTCL